MRQIFLVTFVSLVIGSVAYSQVIDEKKFDDEEMIFTKVPVEASTNPRAFADHIKRKTQLPDSVTKTIPVGKYTVSVQFVIDKHGNMGQIKALNDPGFGLATIAVRAISTYNGDWKPAVQCGRNVKAYRTQPVVFMIQGQ